MARRGSKPRRHAPSRGGRTRRDGYTVQARHDGFPARSVYKLEEIDRRVGLFRRGQRVLDLGAVPGSWTLYAAQRVGVSGSVLGVDLEPFRGALPAQARIVQGDGLKEDLDGCLGSDARFDVVLSDMAPATTGHRHLDMTRSFALAMAALRTATRRLQPPGAFVAKIFQGPDFSAAQSALRRCFAETRVLRPRATRSKSYEVFLFGRGLRQAGAATFPEID